MDYKQLFSTRAGAVYSPDAMTSRLIDLTNSFWASALAFENSELIILLQLQLDRHYQQVVHVHKLLIVRSSLSCHPSKFGQLEK